MTINLFGTRCIALFCFAAVISPLQAAPGDLDPTFAGTGKLRAGFGGGADSAKAVAAQSDGKIVVAVNFFSLGGFSVRRYNSDGTLDTSFQGKDQIFAGTANALKLQPSDGKVLVAGDLYDNGTDNRDFLVVRLNTDGSLDDSFGTNGTVITPILNGAVDIANDLAVQAADNKIVVVGTTTNDRDGSYFAAVRYETNGSLDDSFGLHGKTTIGDIGTDTGNAVVLSGSTIIMAGGYHTFDGSSSGFRLFRLSANGGPDPSFNGGMGTVITPLGSDTAYATSLAIQPAAQLGQQPTIVVAGLSSRQCTIVRYNLDGTLDKSFDGDGILLTGISGQANAVAIQKSGPIPSPIYKIVIGGGDLSFPGNNFIVARYNSSGAADTSFDGDGMAVTSFGANVEGCWAIALSGSRLIAAGDADEDIALVRYNSDGSLDTTFDGDGKKVEDLTDKNATVATSAAIQPDGKVVIAGTISTSATPPALTYGMMRFTAGGMLDTSFGGGTGKVSAPFGTNETIRAIALQSDGKIIAVGGSISTGSNSKFAVRRFAADGTLEQTLRSTFAGEAMAVAIQPDGKIVAAGALMSSTVTGPNADFEVMRVVSDASGLSFDPTFGANGGTTINLGSNDDMANAVAIQTDGKIVAAGKSGNAFAAARCNPDGSLDLSFSGDGKVRAQFGTNQNEGKAVAIQGDGRIVITGRADTSIVTVRYDTAGLLDGSFGSNGAVVTPLSADTSGGEALALQPDGRILVVASDNGDFVVLRYDPNGSSDGSFGVGGKAVIDVSNSTDFAHAIALDTSGRAIVAGEAVSQFGVTRISVDSTPIATPTATPGLVANVATRLPVGTGDNVLIEGFTVQGPAGSTKKIIVRALGPFLTQFGITDALANPTLEIHDANAGNATVATNDDWRNTQVGGLITGDQSGEIAASGVAPGNDLESAIISNLAPGTYTAVVRGAGNTTGTGVVDAYDLSAATPARLANTATRGLIQPGDKLLIAGFIIQNAPLRAVVRAIGPSLSAFGITNALPDTTLQLRDQNGAIVRENDDWKSDQQQDLMNTGLQPSDDREAALVETLAPGSYTAQVRGKPETTGIGVVEIYFLQ